MSEYIIDWDDNLVIDTFSKNSLREEVVRCKYCAYFMDYEYEYEPNLDYCGFHDIQEVRDSRFCAWGERKGVSER